MLGTDAAVPQAVRLLLPKEQGISRPVRKSVKMAASGGRRPIRAPAPVEEPHEGALQRMLVAHGCPHSWERCGCRRIGAVEHRMAPKPAPLSQASTSGPPQLVESLGGGAANEVAKCARPEPEHSERPAAVILLAANIAERLRHLRAKRATEARGI